MSLKISAVLLCSLLFNFVGLSFSKNKVVVDFIGFSSVLVSPGFSITCGTLVNLSVSIISGGVPSLRYC